MPEGDCSGVRFHLQTDCGNEEFRRMLKLRFLDNPYNMRWKIYKPRNGNYHPPFEVWTSRSESNGTTLKVKRYV